MILNGTGGANTNATGLKFEARTDLATSIAKNPKLMKKYDIRPHQWKKYDLNGNRIHYHNYKNKAYDLLYAGTNKRIGVITKQNQFYNVLYELYGLKNNNTKQWKPDECFFNTKDNTIFIVEKKWQAESGSNDEKILTFGNKRKLYQHIFNNLSYHKMKALHLICRPEVEFCALFNSSWWLKHSRHYRDYFNILRDDCIRIFFDHYKYWWFGL